MLKSWLITLIRGEVSRIDHVGFGLIFDGVGDGLQPD
jgi:hypothetical protein